MALSSRGVSLPCVLVRVGSHITKSVQDVYWLGCIQLFPHAIVNLRFGPSAIYGEIIFFWWI